MQFALCSCSALPTRWQSPNAFARVLLMYSATRSSKKNSIYGVHPGIAMVQKWIVDLPEKTGRSLDEWLALVEKSGPPSEAERREWLKKEHKLGTNSAWWIAERAAGKGYEDSDPEAYLVAATGYVEAMFSGKGLPLAALRCAIENWFGTRKRREGLSRQNNCAVLSPSCVRPD